MQGVWRVTINGDTPDTLHDTFNLVIILQYFTILIILLT